MKYCMSLQLSWLMSTASYQLLMSLKLAIFIQFNVFQLLFYYFNFEAVHSFAVVLLAVTRKKSNFLLEYKSSQLTFLNVKLFT